ncbi:hypothetical protein COU54_05470 [Candidatus Pacearchaeota archaeon CG10_big_fil_rev_8_21_14_0_10_31_24]|nr:MAG: hypothetical protein COU54_05470 [Candidatus Pacearchaeota archaeon CG10_big_fil_rev_8_21_14_0_10_31_24]
MFRDIVSHIKKTSQVKLALTSGILGIGLMGCASDGTSPFMNSFSEAMLFPVVGGVAAQNGNVGLATTAQMAHQLQVADRSRAQVNVNMGNSNSSSISRMSFNNGNGRLSYFRSAVKDTILLIRNDLPSLQEDESLRDYIDNHDGAYPYYVFENIKHVNLRFVAKLNRNAIKYNDKEGGFFVEDYRDNPPDYNLIRLREYALPNQKGIRLIDITDEHFEINNVRGTYYKYFGFGSIEGEKFSDKREVFRSDERVGVGFAVCKHQEMLSRKRVKRLDLEVKDEHGRIISKESAGDTKGFYNIYHPSSLTSGKYKVRWTITSDEGISMPAGNMDLIITE